MGTARFVRVRRVMETDDADTIADRLEEILFAFLTHRVRIRAVAAAFTGQRAAAVEDERIILAQIAVENASVFRADDFVAEFFADFGDDFAADAQAGGRINFRGRMEESVGAFKIEQLLFGAAAVGECRAYGSPDGGAESGSEGSGEKFTSFHGTNLLK